ncbi:MAG: sigma-54-dependent transcriptional regulator [Deltaproteobacteria bacterium]
MQHKYRAIIVDDELANLESLERILKSDGADVTVFLDPQEALASLKKGWVDVLLTDLRMRSWSGMDLLEAVKHVDPAIEIIMMTAFGTVELAVEAMKKGAYDFITKPLQRIQVLKSIHKALDRRQLIQENDRLREAVFDGGTSGRRDILGKSDSIGRMMEVALQAARSRANVLIEGESGTGKGLLAQYIHDSSESAQLKKGIFVKINCTAIPDNLLEAELFGYEPGAFTGATKRKQGKVELAHNGTLFLDEIGIAPPTLQSKLLRFLQEGEFERLGSNETKTIETRVISATNVDLKGAIHKGEFREDLFYRLNVLHIRVPSLRERLEDIPVLAAQFIADSAKKNGREVPLIHPGVLEQLTQYSWPGNIRELQNLMERLVVLNTSGEIRPDDLPQEFGGIRKEREIRVPIGLPLKRVEKLLFEETLKSTQGDKKLAARLLGVHPRTIYRYLEQSSKPNYEAVSSPSPDQVRIPAPDFT